MNTRVTALVLIGVVISFCSVVPTGATAESAIVQDLPPLPSAYDLRNVEGKCYITPVGMQAGTLPDGQPDAGNFVGACWAFAAVASFESNLLKQGIVQDPTTPAVNLSVWHMANWNGYNYPVYTFNPEHLPNYTLSFGYTESEPVIRGWGGDHRYAIDYLIRGRGPVPDSDAPFPVGAIQNKTTLTPPPEDLPVSYLLREALVFSRTDYTSDEEFRTAVKHALMQYGALESYHYADPSMYTGPDRSRFFNRTSGDYYYDGTNDGSFPVFLNHAVTIAGWNDTRMIPGAPEPGAWLIKNSLGTDFSDEGYFWISYADAVFLRDDDMAVAFIADSGEGYDAGHRYETHAGALSNISTEPYEIAWDYLSDGFAAAGEDSWACARFIAGEDTFLQAVGFMTLNRNETVTVAVYGGWDSVGTRPDPVTLRFSERIQVPEQGYHLVDLSRKIPLGEGDEFAIVLGFAARDDREDSAEPLVYVAADNPPVNTTFRSSSDPAKGRSGWEDYATLHNGSIFFVQGFTVDQEFRSRSYELFQDWPRGSRSIFSDLLPGLWKGGPGPHAGV